MSKARSMYAGSSGSNYGVNKNSPGNGNGKWQGLWPSVGHARNVRYINTRAGGDNRNVVFCMNQLGGVGRISKMFATTADGVKEPCPGADNSPWWYNNHNIIAAINIVLDYIRNNQLLNPDPFNPSTTLTFIGDHESLKTDHITSHSGHNPNNPSWLFEPLEPRTTSSEVNNAINLLNSMKLQFPVNGKMQLHVIGIVGKDAQERLIEKGYLRIVPLSSRLEVSAFGDAINCASRGGASGQPYFGSCDGAYVGYRYSGKTCRQQSNKSGSCLECCNTGAKYMFKSDGTRAHQLDQCGMDGNGENSCSGPNYKNNCVVCAAIDDSPPVNLTPNIGIPVRTGCCLNPLDPSSWGCSPCF